MAITLTQTQVLLLNLLLSNAISLALDQFSELSDDEIDSRLIEELKRAETLRLRRQQ